jgi:hypothetical protein
VNSIITPGAVESGLNRAVLHLFLLLSGALLCGQSVTAFAAPAETVNTAPDSTAAGVKRPLPARAATTDQTTPAVAEKKSGGSETEHPAPHEKQTAAPASGVIKPLPIRTLATGRKIAISAGSDEKKAPNVGGSDATTAGKSVAEPSTGEKRPLPTRTVATGLKQTLETNADEKTAEVPSNGEKRRLPLRTMARDKSGNMAEPAEAIKERETEQVQPVLDDRKVVGTAIAEKRPLPLRTVAQDQNQSAAVKTDSKQSAETGADRTGAGETQSSSSLTGIKRPLPSRSPTQDLKTSSEVKKPLEAVQRQPGPGANVATEKRPLPLRSALIDQKTAAPAKAEITKLPAAEKTPPAAAENKTAPVAAAQKTAAVVKKQLPKDESAATKTEQKLRTVTAGSSAGNWTVMVGNYLLESALITDLDRVKKAGFTGLVKPGDKKKTVMSRLLLAEFNDRGAAQAALDKLKRHTADAFILDQGGVHAVFAGSYLLDSRASSEKARLAAAGFTLNLKKVEVAIPSKNLSAGRFKDKKSAEAACEKLKSAGITATLVRQ